MAARDAVHSIAGYRPVSIKDRCQIMRVLHVCKFRSAGASRVQMQLKWDLGAVMDVDDSAEIKGDHYPLSCSMLFVLLRKRLFSTFVFHMQSSVPYLLLALIVRFLLRSPVTLVYDIHDLNEWPPAGPAYMRFRFCVFWALERIVIPRVTNVITVSRGLSWMYHRRYGRSPVVVYNAPAVDAEAGSRSGPRRADLVYFGLIDKTRLPRHTVEAIAESGMVLDIYGIVQETDPAYLAWLDDRVKLGSVRLMGRYGANDLRFLWKYVFALLVYEEGEVNVRYCLPNKVFQAALHELPCLVSRGLVECRMKFRRFPQFVCTMPANEKLAGFLTAPRSPPNFAGLIEFVGALHERSRHRYMACLAGRGA